MKKELKYYKLTDDADDNWGAIWAVREDGMEKCFVHSDNFITIRETDAWHFPIDHGMMTIPQDHIPTYCVSPLPIKIQHYVGDCRKSPNLHFCEF